MPDQSREPASDYAWLTEAAQSSSVVLTASRRLARELRSAYDRDQMRRGETAWHTPMVCFWHDWCRALLLDNADAESPRFLSVSASGVLWEECFRRRIDVELLGVSALVRESMNAWQRLQEWCVPLDDVEAAAATADERLYVRVAQDYESDITARGYLDSTQIPAAAVKLILGGACTLPKHFWVTGFDRTSPLLGNLLDALRQRQCQVRDAPQAAQSAKPTVQSFADVESEVRAAGHWARRQLERNPAARIAVVSSDLNTEGTRFARLIREGLVPGWQTGSANYRHAVNVSFGRRLSDYPAIATALLALRWISSGLEGKEVSVLLRSAFWSDHDPGTDAALDLKLRRYADRQWSTAALVDVLGSDEATTGASVRLDRLREIAKLNIRINERQSPVQWASVMQDLLDSLGWPGDAAQSSEDFQLVNRWRELLNEFAALDVVSPSMSLRKAVSKLAALAGETVYQADTGPGLVSLLGTLEAAGMGFDHLWVVGLDADRWPAAGNPLALVSRRLQRDRSMPDAEPADSLEYSRRVLTRLLSSATSCSLSWSRSENDTVQMQSPLLDTLATESVQDDVDPGWYASSWLNAASAKVVSRDPVPTVQGVEALAGGAGIVALQWQDPFSAFAIGRLGIRELETFQAGLSPRLRGIVLHDALETLLHEKPSRDVLRLWLGTDIDQRIERSVDRAIARCEPHADALLRRLLAFERRRLRTILKEFLRQECDRAPFDVSHVEEKLAFEHAGLSLRLRADRIDVRADGSFQIIDYKSGASKKRVLDQHGELVEPQLIVYAAATSQPVSALLVINVSRRAIDYVGVGGEWGKVTEEEWPLRLSQWKQRVFSSLEEIAAGDVRVNLSPGKSAYPQLDVLSRVEELRRSE